MTDPNQDSLARQFEAHRRHLRGVAYKLLGSLTEADDVVQEAWLRLTRPSGSPIERLRPWLTTVVARICLDQLRARRRRREEPIESFVPDLLVSEFEGLDPADEATQADMLTLGILVVLERLSPAERIAFVMHDVFGFPFERIASIVEKTPSATRQLASRARRRVRTIAPQQDSDLQAQKQAVGAFLDALKTGNTAALVAVLAPDCVLRADRGTASPVIRGATEIAQQALLFSRAAASARQVVVNGRPGLLSFDLQGKPYAILGFTVARGRITEIFVISNPARTAALGVLNNLGASPEPSPGR